MPRYLEVKRLKSPAGLATAAHQGTVERGQLRGPFSTTIWETGVPGFPQARCRLEGGAGSEKC